MILWKSKEEPETRRNMPCTAFRWTFQARLVDWPGAKGFDIGFIHQHQSNGKWYDGHDAYCISLTNKFNIGVEHVYYDCPHCCYGFGFLAYYRGANWNCKKCMEGM